MLGDYLYEYISYEWYVRTVTVQRDTLKRVICRVLFWFPCAACVVYKQLLLHTLHTLHALWCPNTSFVYHPVEVFVSTSVRRGYGNHQSIAASTTKGSVNF